MPDGLHDHDILQWAERQAELLRRLARGERVNDAVDWPNLIEEVEDVGRSELHSCESLVVQALTHLLKIEVWPDSADVPHWRGEAVVFMADARRRYVSSMRPRISMQALYDDALRAVRAHRNADVNRRLLFPSLGVCPLSIEDIVSSDADLDSPLERIEDLITG